MIQVGAEGRQKSLRMLRWIARTAALFAVAVLAAGVVAPAVAASSKTLPIDEDLRANADVLKVSMRVQKPNSIWDFKFGEYAVVSSKFGVTETTKTHKLFSLIEHSRTKQKFSFVMQGAGPATAKVKAAQKVEADAFRDIEVSPGVYVGVEPSSGVTDNLVALIAIDGEAPSQWTLLLNVSRGSAGLAVQSEASWLTDGTREILVTPLTSAGPSKNAFDLPARGYQFSDEGKAIGAVQYYAGGALGLFKNVVYLRRDIEPQTKLLLAAAMTAIMQVKLNAVAE
jgi:hypothetical protein